MEYRLSEIENKRIWGRCSSTDDGIALFWTGSGIEVNVSAGYLYADIESTFGTLELWIDVFVDDARIMHFPLLEGRHRYQLMRGFDKSHETNVRIARSTQSMMEECASVIKVFSFDTDGEFLPVKKRKYSLEFVGDSITSGEGAYALSREEWIPTVFDSVNSYAYMTAKMLDADYSILSQSGQGLFASWDGSTECSLPKVYPYVCAAQISEDAKKLGCMDSWDFTGNKKDAVIINLGTNDSSAMKLDKWSEDEFLQKFKTCGIDFLKSVRESNPDSVIIWAYGMLGNEMEEHIRDIIGTYNTENGDNVTYLRLPDCTGIHVGARLHPDPEGHRIAAEALADCIGKIMEYE
ncbi:SGNH/GDSL hydrolase family protein [Butyrivibrio sp. AC2005]|uniref:SGNH/GDSL hydrolase family protein n=1 Tax=Butyrivibrio sp. AC2005 TaxID=1280672 RepID=UPI0003F7BF7B|nr:SGNH/GDSL hydrolase family protein [Butyrivibrio sp. AC2005]